MGQPGQRSLTVGEGRRNIEYSVGVTMSLQFEDTERVIRRYKSKDRQQQWPTEKGQTITNNVQQYTSQKTNI